MAEYKVYEDSNLSLRYKAYEGTSAFWFEYDGQDRIIIPCVLFNGMQGSDDCTYLELGKIWKCDLIKNVSMR